MTTPRTYTETRTPPLPTAGGVGGTKHRIVLAS